MKILLVSSFFPYPLYSGGQVRLYNLLRFLGKRHEVTLVCESRNSIAKKEYEEISKYCKKIYITKRERQWSVSNILKTGLSAYPFLLIGHRNNEMKKILSEEIKSANYDLIHAETFYIMHNIPKTDLPVLLIEHNVEYEIYRKWVDNFRLFFLRPFLYIDILKLMFWEKHYWSRADNLVAVSDSDQKIMEQIAKKKVDIVPNGVDCKYFSEIAKKEPKIPTIVFAGSFKWMQNRDAANYILRSLWPKIKKRIKNVKLWIVGNYAKESLHGLNDKRVLINNRVEDIRRAYSSSTILLAPIRIGGGTKFKILESMASGLPVVTTKKGVEGLGKETNGIMIGDTDEELVNNVITLLTDNVMRNQISGKEKEFVARNFDWEEICIHLQHIYLNTRGLV